MVKKLFICYMFIMILILPYSVDAKQNNSMTMNQEEIAIKIDNITRGIVCIRVYSTQKLTENINYNLYTIKKENYKWKKDWYIRTIELPPANKQRVGKKIKYKFQSEKYEITGLEKNTIYALVPTKTNCHYSKPFWRKPLT